MRKMCQPILTISLYADYGKLKKQVKKYDIIKQNIDSILKIERQQKHEMKAVKESKSTIM